MKPKPPTTKRECLKCGRKFGSTGFGNRLCGKCGSDNATTYVPKMAHDDSQTSNFKEPEFTFVPKGDKHG